MTDSANKDKLILLLLRKDLRKIYMKTLVDRLHDSGVTVAVDETNYPEEKQKKFHWILSYPGDIPKGKAHDASSLGLIFVFRACQNCRWKNCLQVIQ